MKQLKEEQKRRDRDEESVARRDVREGSDLIKGLKIYNLHVSTREKPYIVGFRQKEMMFNDKQCRLIMLKNLTTEVEYEKASFEKDSLEKMALTMCSKMKTPLNVVSQAVEVLLYSERNEKNLKTLKLIQDANCSVMHTVNDYIDYTMLKKGQFLPRVERFELKPAIMSVLDMYKMHAESNRLIFNIDFDIDNPKSVLADKQRLLQVLRNYAGNALKYTTRGSISVFVCFNWHE